MEIRRNIYTFNFSTMSNNFPLVSIKRTKSINIHDQDHSPINLIDTAPIRIATDLAVH